jgi:hypothetical protein
VLREVQNKFTKLQTNISLHQANVGLSVNKFQRLYNDLAPDLLNSTLECAKIAKQVTGHPRAFSARDSLYIFLIHMRHYPITQKMCFDYGFVGEDTMLQYLKWIRDIAFKWAKPKIQIPDADTRWNNGVFFNFNNTVKRVTLLGDNSEQLVGEFLDAFAENSTFSGKKNDNTFTRFHLISPYGRGYYAGMSHVGSVNDMGTVWWLKDMLRTLRDSEAIMLDGGYPGVVGPNVLRKKPNQKQWNAMIDRYRVIVENHFAQIKHWAICNERFRFKYCGDINELLQIHHEYWCIVTALTNEFTKPLRTWKQFHANKRASEEK